ncbi:hypothetical protein SAY86_011018 [Trapa natans]|uniref:Trichome birefringence-like N-terminal domain-containing protein n=1 Tax=Trapa natans TaxID=22666 RepID=A0AAN7LKH6_TRANT|nr:hypothetical protein SAY86_011018 [Trapa natans]
MDTVDGRWRICILLSFLGVTFLVFHARHIHDNPFSFSSPRSIGFSIAPIDNFTFNPTSDPRIITATPSSIIKTKDEQKEPGAKCDIFQGKWVYDSKLSPLYDGARCPFLSDQVTCRRNQRPDSHYERWNWEGSQCNIPRFNGTDMLERLRGKRMIIVGDSLNRNQWESLACLLYSSVPSSDARVSVKSSTHKIFRAKSYNCSVEFYWSPFLVHLETNSINGSKVLVLDRLSDSARRWRGAGVMVFNTGHWWVHRGKLQVWDFLKYKGKLVQNMEMEEAFKRAMKTWASWMDRNVNKNGTKVFFRSISPEHKGEFWCHNVTEPALDGSYHTTFPKSITKIVEKTMHSMKTPVKSLSITRLSEYRRDGHPTVYTTRGGKLLTDEQRKKPEVYADCSHWCLPGVPDTWNRLLYASMVQDSHEDGSSSLYKTT